LGPHDQTLADAFKAAAITFRTAWLTAGKRAMPRRQCSRAKKSSNRKAFDQLDAVLGNADLGAAKADRSESGCGNSSFF